MNYISCEDYAKMRKEKLKAACEFNRISLAIIQVGDNEASNRYIKGKMNDCREVGFNPILFKYDSTTTEQLVSLIEHLNHDIDVSGIIVQLPLPDGVDAKAVGKAISPKKDVDGFNSDLFDPCTPKGIIDYLTYNKVNFDSKHCVVVGRSEIVGKPLAKMLTDRNATVTLCHSHTKSLDWYTQNADIVVSAVGKRNIITAGMINNGTIVIDVGINFDENGKLCGDCDYEDIVDRCELVTPVPKGVGLLTRVALLENVYRAEMMRFTVSSK